MRDRTATEERAIAAIRRPPTWKATGRNLWSLKTRDRGNHTLRSIPTGFRGRHFELDNLLILSSVDEADLEISNRRTGEKATA